MNNWCPFAIRDPAVDVSAGAMVEGHPYKGGLHSTEGQTYGGARSAYVANNTWPHFTYGDRNWAVIYRQHTPLSRASRAARNLAGGHEIGRDGLIQIEIVGTCNPPNRNKPGWQFLEDAPKEYLDGLARLMRWIEGETLIQRVAPGAWKPYPESYGSNGIRFSSSAWHEFRGWCGHQHFPENTHGDPGLININYLLAPGGSQGAWKWSNHVPLPQEATSSCRDPLTGGYWLQTAEGGVDGFHGAWTYTGIVGNVPGGFHAYKDHPELGGNVRYFVAIVPNGRGGFVQIANDRSRYEFSPYGT